MIFNEQKVLKYKYRMLFRSIFVKHSKKRFSQCVIKKKKHSQPISCTITLSLKEFKIYFQNALFLLKNSKFHNYDCAQK